MLSCNNLMLSLKAERLPSRYSVGVIKLSITVTAFAAAALVSPRSVSVSCASELNLALHNSHLP